MSCTLCNRECTTTEHHLIPRTVHSNKWFEKNFDKMDMRTRKIDLCKDCHRFVHDQWEEKYLGKHLNTLELLLKEEKIQDFLRYIKKQKISND